MYMCHVGGKKKGKEKSNANGAGKGTGEQKKAAPAIIEFKRDLLVVSARWVKNILALLARILVCVHASHACWTVDSSLLFVFPAPPDWKLQLLSNIPTGLDLCYVTRRHCCSVSAKKNLEAGHEALTKGGGFLVQHSDLPKCKFVVLGIFFVESDNRLQFLTVVLIAGGFWSAMDISSIAYSGEH
eukprot:g15509.t1